MRIISAGAEGLHFSIVSTAQVYSVLKSNRALNAGIRAKVVYIFSVYVHYTVLMSKRNIYVHKVNIIKLEISKYRDCIKINRGKIGT